MTSPTPAELQAMRAPDVVAEMRERIKRSEGNPVVNSWVYRRDLTALIDALVSARAALEKFADPTNWGVSTEGGSVWNPPALDDALIEPWDLARAHLGGQANE